MVECCFNVKTSVPHRYWFSGISLLNIEIVFSTKNIFIYLLKNIGRNFKFETS